MGTETLLAGTNETSASNQETVPDLKQFRFLMICAGTASGAIYNPTFIPVVDFKTNRVSMTTRVLVNAYIGGAEMNVSCYYVNDTTIGLSTTNTYARVYGIK